MKSIRVLAAFDKYKDCMGAESVGKACFQSLNSIFPNQIIPYIIPLSDGGEGFLFAFTKPLQLQTKKILVTGPLGTPVEAEYGMNKDSSTAVVEMARASGIELVPENKRNPLHTTSRGTGELILDAYKNGCRKIILGVGGTATNDGGLGALQALGLTVKLKDTDGTIFEPNIFYGKHLDLLHSISTDKPLIPGTKIEISCDVTSPFVGPHGATYTFSGQKGASATDKEILERGMNKAASLLKNSFKDISDVSGAGAAGGLPGGFVAVLDANIKRGIEVICDLYKVEEAIKNSDVVLTGEGTYDSTTKAGKVVQQVRELGKRNNKPVIVLCGRKKDVDETDTHIYDLLSVCDVNEAMNNTTYNLDKLIRQNIKNMPILKDLHKG